MPVSLPVNANSPFLSDVLAALKKRSRALKHRNATPAVDRIIEIIDGNPLERVEIEIGRRPHQTLRVIAWEDRAIWVHASELVPKAGWKFQFTDSGRLVGRAGPRELVGAIEASLSAMYGVTADDLNRLVAVWGPLLAKGPKEI